MGTLTSLLGFRNIRGQFFAALERFSSLTFTPRIASMYDSDQASETYNFLNEIPAMRQWTGGRQAKGLKGSGITVVNEVFENTLYVNIDDLRRDKTGQILRRVSEQAERAAELPDKLITQLIAANGNSFDGVAYFADTHASGDNNLAFTTASGGGATPTPTEMEQVIRNQVQAIYGFVDTEGEPMNQFAKNFAVMVPTHYMGATVAAVRNLTLTDASGVMVRSQTGAMQEQLGMTFMPIVNPRLSGNVSYLFRTDAPIGAFIWQDEVPTSFDGIGEDSEHRFKHREVLFGVERVCNAALGRHQYAVRTTLS